MSGSTADQEDVDSAPTGDYLLDGDADASAITHIATLDQKVLGEA